MYSLSSEDTQTLAEPEKVVVCEIWNALPSDYEFKPMVCGSGEKAQVAEMGKKVYIWIPPPTVEVLAKHPMLMAFGYPRRDGIIKFIRVEAKPPEITSADYIAQARDFNNEQLAKAEKKKR